MFLMLALSVLNYGSRLETLISKSKSKNSSRSDQEESSRRLGSSKT